MTGIPDEAVDAFIGSYIRCPCADFDGDRCCVRAGLAAALPHLAATIRAQVAEEIATAISTAYEPTGPIDVTTAYHHAAHLAWQLRVPDCGDQYHGADGGPCSGCGFDAADMPPSGAAQIAADAPEGVEGRSGPETALQAASGHVRGTEGLLPVPLVAAQPRTAGDSPAASPDQPDAPQTPTAPRITQEDADA